MKPRQKRFAIVVGGLAALGIAAALILNAFQSNLVFFFTPTQVAGGEAPKGRAFRIGGLVKEGSLERSRHHRALCGHRHRQGNPGELQGHPARPLPGGQRRGGPGQPEGRTACSPPPKCWPSTTRTTCRPRPRPRSIRPTTAPQTLKQ